MLIIIIIFFTRGRYDPSGDIITIIEYYCLEDQASSFIAEGKVPRKATRLNLWMAIDRRKKRNAVSRLSPVMADIRLPIWLMKSHAEGSSGLRVSIDTGWKTCVVGKAAYFIALQFAAWTDAGPTDAACGEMYDAAHVWTTVASHARYFPADQGTSHDQAFYHLSKIEPLAPVCWGLWP